MKVIVYTRPGGGLSIVRPAVEAMLAGESEDAFIQRVMAKDIPADASDVQILEPSAIPEDRAKRRAWRRSGTLVVVDDALVIALKDQDAIRAIDGMDRLQFEHLFELENRTRVLEAKLPITREQYRNALIERWKVLYG